MSNPNGGTVKFSSTFAADLDELVSRSSVPVVRGILESMWNDPQLALATVNVYLSNLRISFRRTLYADFPYSPVRTQGVASLSYRGEWVYYLERDSDCDLTIVYQEEESLYTVQSIDNVIEWE